MNTKDKLTKARTMLILDHPFFGCLSLKFDLIEDKRFETAATDSKSLYYNPKFIDKISLQQTKGLFAHEVLHCALGHIWREGKRKHNIWIQAADYSINNILTDAHMTLPDGALTNNAYRGLSTEEIYDKLLDKQQQQDKQQSQSKDQKPNDKDKQQDEKQDKQQQQNEQYKDPGRCGSFNKPTEKSKEEINNEKIDWKIAITQASHTANVGNLPGELRRMIKEIIEPSIPWHVLLRDFVEKSAKNDYNWNQPSRRYIASGFILPSLISEELPQIVIVIDTSGSINQKQLDIFAAEVSAVISSYKTTLKVIYCDYTVRKEEEFTTEDIPIKLKPVGGGGTDFRPPFELVKKKGYEPACLIYFTDLQCGSFPKEPEYPVMWITTDETRKAPFGETIRFK